MKVINPKPFDLPVFLSWITIASSSSPKEENRIRRVSEVVSEERPRMKSFRREMSPSATERTELRMSEWWSVADWRMSNSWSFVKGSRILRISSGVRGVIGDCGEVPVGIEMPFSSALRFLMNSMVAEVVVVDCWLAWNKP